MKKKQCRPCGIFFLKKKISTLSGLIFAWINFRDFRVFWPFSRNFVHAKILGTADSRNFVHAKFLEILIAKITKIILDIFCRFFFKLFKRTCKNVLYLLYLQCVINISLQYPDFPHESTD